MGKEIKTQGSPSELINLAIEKGADLDKLEKLLSLKERYEANEARKVYTKAFSSAQEKIEVVVKTKVNPQTHSKYAPLEGIIKSTKPIYTKEGFSVIFYEGETTRQEQIRVCADVLHNEGHKETYYYDVPLDGVGIKGNPNMTKIHAKASSVAYGRRYLMCMIWNIPTGDDDDAVGQDSTVGIGQAATIRKGLLELGGNAEAKEAKLLKYLKASSIEEIAKADYQKAITAIEATPKAAKKAPKKEEQVEEKSKPDPKAPRNNLQAIRKEVVEAGEKKGWGAGSTIERIEKHLNRGYWELTEFELLDILNLLKEGNL